jgi:hypothetical protein
MAWYAFKDWANNSYPPVNVAGIQEKNLTVLGFHGYATQTQAIAHPNTVNLVNASIVALTERDYQTAVASGEQPGGPQSNLGGAITNPGKFIAGTAASEFFHGINLSGWLLRVGELILGVVLIGVGIAKLTGTDNVIMKAATTAGKLAIL